MCEPVVIGGVITAAGTIIKAQAAQAQGNAAFAASAANAAGAERAAGDAVARAQLTEMRAALRGTSVVAAQRAGFTSSGVDINSGSALDVQRDTAIFSKEDEDIIRNNAYREATSLRSRAREFYQQGQNARAAANNDTLASVIGGVGAVAMAGGKAWIDRVPSPDYDYGNNGLP